MSIYWWFYVLYFHFKDRRDAVNPKRLGGPMKQSRLANTVPRLSTRATWVALGPCRRSGPPSRRPGWSARCPSATSPSTTCGPSSRCRVRTGEAPPSSASSTPSGESRLRPAIAPPVSCQSAGDERQHIFPIPYNNQYFFENLS